VEGLGFQQLKRTNKYFQTFPLALINLFCHSATNNTLPEDSSIKYAFTFVISFNLREKNKVDKAGIIFCT
jgi:hypothetical protein